ncbi:MAG: hypothetical protein P4L84_09260 [Isosphaeraceae bacterium]|nr:hypothetical protein [Isosphaeraceae bacterium]
MQGRLVGALLEIVGAILGGVVGYFAFIWLVQQGFYGLMLPGALVGLGCGLFARRRSVVRGVTCALAGLALELFAEWKTFPFAQDESFGFMLSHFHEKAPIKIIMLLAGALLAFWLGKDAGFSARFDTSKSRGPSNRSDADGPSTV